MRRVEPAGLHLGSSTPSHKVRGRGCRRRPACVPGGGVGDEVRAPRRAASTCPPHEVLPLLPAKRGRGPGGGGPPRVQGARRRARLPSSPLTTSEGDGNRPRPYSVVSSSEGSPPWARTQASIIARARLIPGGTAGSAPGANHAASSISTSSGPQLAARVLRRERRASASWGTATAGCRSSAGRGPRSRPPPHLAAHGLLQRLAGLHEARQRAVERARESARPGPAAARRRG